ncbi:ectonucleotide pyrophosphatase/phosphodiesterase [Stakelama saccharophila]|uniref:Ectonucleotide pyrophosphatase/phosphodiesterase n=1 Tax=Stakelama saccharophila TaxID=3075605 RepID=A0ABZ0B726_9SPHN|nr:ectonucleotide pyrophosphatase/phosphodiesterase [Stakelama sp. W311]WNO53211.1 ectonucleotide pyrophosphatase/phosphodiesterase [Stakelama sp. W311]
MQTLFRIAALGLAAMLPACAPQVSQTPRTVADAAPAAREPVTILVSIDGFRPDYLDRGVTPNLSRLKASGVFSRMIPSFPSKTFPNHWAIATGEYPDHNGITANKMEDPRRPGEVFNMASDDPFWWNEAKPIWVAAEQAGIRTATMFWPGSNVAWGGTMDKDWPHAVTGGTRPQDWQQFAQAVSGTQRVNAVLDWLRRPAGIRPKLVTLYFDTVDTAGHAHGPQAKETTAVVADVDDKIGMLLDGLERLDQPANLIVVSDHGMAATSTARTVALDRFLPAEDIRVVESGPYASLEPTKGHEDEVAAKLLGKHEHMTCWRKQNIPVRFHYGANRRIPPIFCLAETGWSIAPTAPAGSYSGGNHGYDNRAPEMAALFIAHGPAFADGANLPPFPNVDVEPLLRDLIGLPAKAGADGTDAPFQQVLTTH